MHLSRKVHGKSQLRIFRILHLILVRRLLTLQRHLPSHKVTSPPLAGLSTQQTVVRTRSAPKAALVVALLLGIIH